MKVINTYTAFDGTQLLFQGTLSEVIPKIKKHIGRAANSSVLIFCDATGKTLDFNFQGTERDVSKRLEIYVSDTEIKENSGPGRPKLGVISREVSLLPRHWEWLATQTGGASATLRSLIEKAIGKSAGTTSIKLLQERAYRFMSVMSGDMKGYEEALRALYKRDKKGFLANIQAWPRDVKNYAMEIAKPIFDGA